MSDDSTHLEIQRAGRPRRGMRDGNDRTARIARWLAEPVSSDRVTELVLECAVSEQEPLVLCRWERRDVTTELAGPINALIEDYADDQATTASAILAWTCADGTRFRSKSFRAACSAEDREHRRPLDGSSLSIITQLQRSVEAKDRMMVALFEASEARHDRQLDIVDRMLDRLERRAVAAEAAQVELEDVAEQAAEVAERATERAEQAVTAAEAAQGNDRVGQVIDLVTKQLMTGDAKG